MESDISSIRSYIEFILGAFGFAMFLIIFSSPSNQITAYSRVCNDYPTPQNLTDCINWSNPMYTTYVVNANTQTVIEGNTGDSAIEISSSCVVIGKDNWSCVGLPSGNFGFNNGKFFVNPTAPNIEYFGWYKYEWYNFLGWSNSNPTIIAVIIILVSIVSWIYYSTKK